MSQTPSPSYQQNYYQMLPENYDDYYENEYEEFQDSCGDATKTSTVPLYAEQVQDMSGIYGRGSQYYETPPPLEVPQGPCRRSATFGLPTEYYYDSGQGYNFTTYQTKPKYGTLRPSSQYPAYPNPDVGIQDAYEPDYHLDPLPSVHHCKLKTCKLHQHNFDCKPRTADYVKDIYAEYRDKRLYGPYGSKIPRSAAVKKFPVTVKTPKYVTKNFIPATINKRPSALCLPVVTQPDPALVRRKSKTNQQIKKNSIRSEPNSPNTYEQTDSFSAHKMHSQGDVKTGQFPEAIDTFLHNFERNAVLDDPPDDDLYDADPKHLQEKENLKEIAKFLKPRVPASIRVRQEKLAALKSKPIQPKMKLSLDKLLNRLQKCENNDNVEKLSEASYKTDTGSKKEKCTTKSTVNIDQVESFNYDELSRKCSPTLQKNDKEQTSNDKGQQMFETVPTQRSLKMVKPLDDHCALDLHRSKSYIVDLIDRALSKELGTVPRGQSVHQDLTPHKAVATINRHRQSHHKELCYEVTAALTDSIISNATAPAKEEPNQLVERSISDNQVKEHTGEDNYIKQLKQLRWGHIRHIQHEARKLADLEEFLEKCGEIEF